MPNQSKLEQELNPIGENPTIQTLIKILSQIEKYIPTPGADDEVVMLFGRTKEGKSTSANILAGHKVKILKTGTKLTLEFLPINENEEISQVGEQAISVTTLPFKLKGGKNKNITFIDFPGFGDRRGIIQSILNALYIQRYFQIYKKCKFIFVNSYPSMDGDATKFIENCELMAALMSEMPDYKNHMGFIITRTDSSANREDIQTELKHNIVSIEEKLKLKPEVVNLIKYMANSDKLAVLPKPDKLNESSQYYERYYTSFVDSINNIVVNKIQQNIKDPKIHLALTDQDREQIKQSVPPLLSQLIQTYFKDLKQALLIHYQGYFQQVQVDSIDRIPILHTVVEKYNQLVNFQRVLVDIQAKHLQDVGKMLKNCFQTHKFKFDNNDLVNQIITIKFFNSIIPQINNSLYIDIAKVNMEKINEEINALMYIYKQKITTSYQKISQNFLKSYLEKLEKKLFTQKEHIKYFTNIINNTINNSKEKDFPQALKNLKTIFQNHGIQYQDIDTIVEIYYFMRQHSFNINNSYDPIKQWGQQQKQLQIEILNSQKGDYPYDVNSISSDVELRKKFEQLDHLSKTQEKNLKSFQNNNQIHKNDSKDLIEKNKELNQILRGYENEKEQLLQENSDLAGNLDYFQQQQIQLTKQNDQLSQKNQQYKSDLNKVNSQIRNLNNENNELRNRRCCCNIF